MESVSNPELPIEAENVDDFLSEPSPELVENLKQLTGSILVLGAGGKMGLHICKMLRRSAEISGCPISVTAVSRFKSLRGREDFEKAGIPTLQCELENESELSKLPDAPNIIFMAGAKFGTSDQPNLLNRMNVELPKKVAKRFAGARILMFSTGCVYSMVKPESGGSDESAPANPPGAYAQSCLEREKAFVWAAEELGSEVCLIRLNYSTEFRYGVLVDLCQKILRNEPVSLEMGWVNVIWQRDAIDQILRAFPLANSAARPLNITGAGIFSVRELSEKLGIILNRPVSFSSSEGSVAWLNDASESHRMFGQPSTSVETMLEWTAAWARQGNDTFDKPTGFEKSNGKY